MNTLAVAALLLASTCAATPQLLGDWDWNVFARFPNYYGTLIPVSEQQETTDLSTTDNILTGSVDHAATLALMSLVMCLKETKVLTQRLEDTMAASVGNLTKELLETTKRLTETNDIVAQLKKELNETRTNLIKDSAVTSQKLQNSTTTFGTSRNDLADISGRITETNATVGHLAKKLAETSQRLVDTTVIVENLKNELNETRSNFTQESKVNSQRLQQAVAMGTTSKNELAILANRLAETDGTLGNLTKKLTEISQNSSKNSQRLVETNVAVGKMKNELAGSSQRLVETNVIVVSLKKELTDTIKQESAKALQCCTNTKSDLTKELKVTGQRLDRTNDTVIKLTKEMNETAKRLTEINMTAGNLKDQNEPSQQAAALQHLIETNIIVVSSKKELAEMSHRLSATNETVDHLKKELLDTRTKVGNLTAELKANTKEAARSIGRMPNSCEDLQQIGHMKSGLYSVMGMKQVETLYCDFTKVPDEEDFQKWIGFNDVKSTPTYFHVSRAVPYNQTVTSIPFTRAVLNHGGAMNKETGKFTAPVSGVYYFYFAATVFLPVTSALSRPDFTMCLFKNSNCVEWLLDKPDEMSTGDRHERISLQSTLNLKQGDQIWLAIGKKKSPGAYLVGDALTNFKGFLIEEDISQSLRAAP